MADANAPLFNMSCFDLLLIELVPLAERMARSYEASLDRPSAPPSTSTTGAAANNRRATATGVGGPNGLANTAASTTPSATTPTSNTNPVGSSGTGTNAASSPGSGNPTAATSNNINPGGGGRGGGGGPASTAGGTNNPLAVMALAADGLPETEIFRDSVYVRLERLGFRVGQGLCERFSRDRPRFTDQLDVIKFICKDLWTVVFKKQIDNLKTNHRGVFVLTDSKFRPFSRMSMTSNAEAVARAQAHLYFPCGIVRGVLSSLGIKATVQAETNELPSATFQIKTTQARP
ncbi:uncharacterized protein A1O9_03163 [Exophiala aquamarina CBS 119918]|uniref:Trafficking protein particle complex subunit 6B n=1 Tax=Exophiala aquamarina CBS 119918 TaxID=1182545 RepID=A0A072Q111_9EURO|nr:uncharacterized protein A1O9_03163 [Exophiala aquamarina CBS 119918]KEF61595.1 hypothetical protein A1O9_03163 [Exophiala aquamarina CBS 119918]